MVVLVSTIITCSQAFGIIDRLQKIVGLTPQQRKEIIIEIRKVIPSCPITIQTKNDPFK